MVVKSAATSDSPGIQCRSATVWLSPTWATGTQASVAALRMPRVLEAAETIEANDSSIGSGDPQVVPCNWLQHWENVIDPYHFNVLHMTHSGPQFGQRMDPNPKRPTFEFEDTRHGVKASSIREVPAGVAIHRRRSLCFQRFGRTEPAHRCVRQAIESCRLDRMDLANRRYPLTDLCSGSCNGVRRAAADAIETGRQVVEGFDSQEHQKYPGDYEAQTAQGESPSTQKNISCRATRSRAAASNVEARGREGTQG